MNPWRKKQSFAGISWFFFLGTLQHSHMIQFSFIPGLCKLLMTSFLTDFGLKGYGLPGKVSNIKVLLNGGQRVTFLRPDGFFSLYPITVLTRIIVFGRYLLTVSNSIGLVLFLMDYTFTKKKSLTLHRFSKWFGFFFGFQENLVGTILNLFFFKAITCLLGLILLKLRQSDISSPR